MTSTRGADRTVLVRDLETGEHVSIRVRLIDTEGKDGHQIVLRIAETGKEMVLHDHTALQLSTVLTRLYQAKLVHNQGDMRPQS